VGLEYQQSYHCWTVGGGELSQFRICGRPFGLHSGLDLVGNWGLVDAIFGNFLA